MTYAQSFEFTPFKNLKLDYHEQRARFGPSFTTTFVSNDIKNLVKENFGIEAVGFWFELVSNSAGWCHWMEHIINKTKFTANKCAGYLKKLASIGLAKRFFLRGEKGRILGSQWVISNVPLTHEEFDMVQDDFFLQAPNDLPATDMDFSPTSVENPSIINPMSNSFKEETLKSNINDKNTMITDEISASWFKDFWEDYPLKRAKKEAETAFKRLFRKKAVNQGEKLLMTIYADVINRDLTDYAWRDKQYIPRASTYLNGELWEDEHLSYPTPKTPFKRDPMNRAANDLDTGWSLNAVSKDEYARLTSS